MSVRHVKKGQAGYSRAYLDLVDASELGDVGPHFVEIEMADGHEQDFPVGAEFIVTFSPVAKPLSESAPTSKLNPRFDVSKAHPNAKINHLDLDDTLRRGEEAAAKAMSEDWRQV